MENTGTDQDTFSVELYRSRETPIRLAFATMVGSHRFWAGYVLGLPLVFVFAASFHRLFLPFSAGIPVGICLLTIWLSHEFIQPQLEIDVVNRTLTKSKPYNRGSYSAIDIDDLEQVSIIPLGNAALVNFHYTALELVSPYATAIETADISTLETRLEQLGIPVTVHERGTTPTTFDRYRVRIVSTPLAVVGTLVVVWQQFGSSAFWTDAVIVPLMVLLGFSWFSTWWRYRLRTSNKTEENH